MDINLQRKLINATSAGIAACAFGAAGWSFSGLGDVASKAQGPVGGTAVTRPSDEASQTTQPVNLSMSLSQTLYDPPPKPAEPKVTPTVTAPPKPRTPKLDLTLVGTIIDDDSSIAMFINSAGKTDIKRIGQTLEIASGGVTIETIRSDQVTLRHKGSESIVKLEKSFKKSGGGPGKSGRNRRRFP